MRQIQEAPSPPGTSRRGGSSRIQEIQIKLQNLKLGRKAIEGSKQTQEKQRAAYLEDIKAQRRKIVQAFQELRSFLEEQECGLLARLSDLEKQEDESSTRLSNNILLLSDLICDLEKHCQRPAGEFLQNLKETLSRCKKGELLCFHEKPVNLEKDLRAISQQSDLLMENFKKFRESLMDELSKSKTRGLNAVLLSQTAQPDQPQIFWPRLYNDAVRADKKVSPVSVTLDPRTANPHLLLGSDRKTVTHLDHRQTLPDNPERFDAEFFVLGCESFCSGKHSWVVNVEQGQNWAIGIARESVRRKGSLSLSPQQGIWAVQQCWGQLQALTSRWTTLFLLRKPKRIRVHLDYEGGWVAFFDAELDAPIFTFPPTSFKRERIHPWFWVASGSQLTLCP
ncbi:tripartite motif-containing protein 15-like isoform X2 [Thamnophis elegans]|uniref:tripartite motif-containing protein 15-like isoform X2 n=1 Tax=Thamnophis elegans TaxID=35005 RepID=UPI0013788721|nr:tripartite motif-containing protein 15-like isoform X2 [Thamnophis elegans]